MRLKYIEVLKEIRKNGWEFCDLEDSMHIPIDKKVFAIRHDIDNDIERSLRMSQIENNFGVSSTYFLLVTSLYFKDAVFYSEQFKKRGHSVGLHLDLLNMVNKTSLTMHDYLVTLLSSLKDEGIVITGTVPHGSLEASKAKFKGYEYFYDYCEEEYLVNVISTNSNMFRDPGKLLMGVHPLKQYNLTYDASQLERKNYISDSHGVIRINTPINQPPNREEDLMKFIKEETGKTIALFHPEHWKDV